MLNAQQAWDRLQGALMSGPIHAFTMQTLTPEEAEAKGIKVGETSSEDGDQGGSGSSSGGLISLG